MAISAKEKELAAVGISVASGCKPCTDFHVKKVREVGASDTEIKQAISAAFAVRRRATEDMESYALTRIGGNKEVSTAERVDVTERAKLLVGIGAAFGVNCVAVMQAHLDAAERAGISREEIATIVKLSAFIKGKASSHVERLADSLERPEATYEKAVDACC